MLGEDANTMALAGRLLGAHEGLEASPSHWRVRLCAAVLSDFADAAFAADAV